MMGTFVEYKRSHWQPLVSVIYLHDFIMASALTVSSFILAHHISYDPFLTCKQMYTDLVTIAAYTADQSEQ